MPKHTYETERLAKHSSSAKRIIQTVLTLFDVVAEDIFVFTDGTAIPCSDVLAQSCDLSLLSS